jgi:hypothetical protein
MKKSKVSAETRDKTIKEADLGIAGWALKAVRRTSALRGRKSGKVPTGEIGYRAAQVLLGLVAFMAIRGIFGIPFNFVSEMVLLCFLFGSQFGAVRFSLFSLVYWGIVGTVLGFLVGMWPLSPSWWSIAAEGWSGGEAVPKIAIGGGILASVVWVATGRLAARAAGRAFSERLEAWTFERSQGVQKQRELDVETEFEKAGVSRAEVDDLARRNESDRRRAVVFGGSTRRRRAEGEGVSLAKADEPEQVSDSSERSQRVADLAGHIDEKDEGILAGLASGPDLGGMFASTPQPTTTAPSYDEDDDIPGPSASASRAVDADDDIPGPSANAPWSSDDDIPGPSNAPQVSPATAIMEIAERVEAPVPAVSAPKINPEASRGRRRMSREDLGKMIDLFNIMSREDNLTMFVNATRSKLVRLTDEDYEELRTMDGGETLITLSQDLKLSDQSRGRTATAVAPVVAEDDTITRSATEMPEITRQVASPAGAMLVDAMENMRTAASGRVPLGAAPAPVVQEPVDGEIEDFENEAAPVVAIPAVAVPPAADPADETPATPPAAEVPDESAQDGRQHEIIAVTSRGESVSFDVDISENEGTDPEMRRYPTPYASERVSILNNPALSDEQKIERLRTLDRSQGVSTVEMFEGDDFGALLNLQPKVVSALRAKVKLLLGEKPSDMNVLQRQYERRLELVEKDMFERPHEYQRILHAFMTVGAEIQDLVVRIDTPQAREIMENSIRLDPWFERNLTGLRAGSLKAPLPRPLPGPGVLDRFSGTVDAAMRGAGFAGRPQAARSEAEDAPRASEAIIDVAPRVTTPVAPVEPVAEVRSGGRRFEKGVDAQWAPDAPHGSDLYNKEMAEHFSMIVRRNDAQNASAEREAHETAERNRREENDRAQRQREEEDRLARAQAETDRERREAEFFATLPKSEGGPFVKHLPARFMTDRIMAAVTGIVDGHVIVSRLHQEYVTQKIAFLNDWQAGKGSQPDAVDELSAPGQRLQAEVAVRNADLAGDLLTHVAEACGLSREAPHAEILARLADDEEQEFVRRVETVRTRGEELRGLIAALDGREKSALAEAARAEARRQIGEAKADMTASGERVQQLETDLRDRAEEVDQLRADASEATARAAAAEAAATQREEAANAAIRAAAEMADRVRELEARIATTAAPAADGDGPVDEEAENLRQFEAFVADHLTPLDVQADLRAYTTKVDAKLLVVVDLPESMTTENVMIVSGHRLSLVEGLKRTVMRPAFNSDPMTDTLEVTIVTNAPLSEDVTGENLDLEGTVVTVCARDAKKLHNNLRAYGVL